MSLDLLIPAEAPLPPSFRYATVTSTNPLRIRLDGDESPLGITPVSLIHTAAGDRVYVAVVNRRLTVLGAITSVTALPLRPELTGYATLIRSGSGAEVVLDISGSLGAGDTHLASGVPTEWVPPAGALVTGLAYLSPTNSGLLYVNSSGNVRLGIGVASSTRVRGNVAWTVAPPPTS